MDVHTHYTARGEGGSDASLRPTAGQRRSAAGRAVPRASTPLVVPGQCSADPRRRSCSSLLARA
jgi:hypothetical protein